MYKLLIVDDEQWIVDWLHRLFSGLEQLDLDLYKAYTGEEAMAWMYRTKIDIVLTDIQMPEMDGMQLLENIKLHWPDCRVIFLSGYEEFEYIYSAFKHEGVSYLLKTEGDAEIIASVEKAVAEIERSFRDAERLRRVQEQVRKALPLLQREWLTALLRGESSSLPVRQERLSQLEMPLRADMPLLMLLGRLDYVGGPKEDQGEKDRLVYAIQNVTEEYVRRESRSAFVHDGASFVWLLQPVAAEADWERTRLFVRETLDSVQRACMESLKAGMSFALSNDPVPWEDLADKRLLLQRLLNGTIGRQSGIVTERGFPSSEPQADGLVRRVDGAVSIPPGLLTKLESSLERGEEREFFAGLDELTNEMNGVRNMRFFPAVELYYTLALKLLSVANRWGLAGRRELAADLDAMLRADRFDRWDDAGGHLRRTATHLFAILEQQRKDSDRDIVTRIECYILDHLAEDVSLVRLGELTGFNPSYLSRLFKQVTGTNISDLIHQARLNKAKELLAGTSLKIHEIAAAIGLDSPAYFAKFFRKLTGMTPQEYREALQKL
ncbi:MAG TPA: helix-turn-helix domain-containing protein [Paenibacillus sp.]|nr:helix-turn-helix domain-containing protein [Paenibacillus sp.]